jgi:uncharacterized protein YqhQ
MREPEAELYGGQAVIEGVMMRDRKAMCIAVRTPGGGIARRHQRLAEHARPAWTRWSFVRGGFSLYDSVRLGVEALLWSAGAAGEEQEQLSSWQVSLVLVTAAALAVGLFMLLPTLVVSPLRTLLLRMVGGGYGLAVLLNLLEGLVRAGILVAYVAVIGRLPDVARVLAYHGAEHRVIHAQEAGAELTPAGARPFALLHPRCGTAFLLYVVFASIVAFSFFGWPNLWQRLLLRLSLLPVVAGVSYEWIKLAGRSKSVLVRALCAPGLWLQRLTTREPDDAQVEVAIAALLCLRQGGEPLEEVAE